jgi:hypothetical protein
MPSIQKLAESLGIDVKAVPLKELLEDPREKTAVTAAIVLGEAVWIGEEEKLAAATGETDELDLDVTVVQNPCEYCRGSGKIGGRLPCNVCRGTGVF